MTDNTINSDMTMGGGASGTLLAGRYRVVKQLGQGGMGSVWLAEDLKLDGHKVAVKMLPSILVSNKRAYQQVKAEALVSLKLSHPNIVTVRAFEEEGGNPFLVMDYIDGQTLDDYLAEKGKLTEEETVKLLKPVAAALDYAHAQGVVHRDVKPGNVMIRKDGTPFVLDFGIAREIQETMTRVTGKLSSGTLLYMSPEQLHGAAPKPSQDIYSFAAMAYECLVGHPPFYRGQIEYQIEHDTPEPLPRHIAICRRVMAGLAKTPATRPATCAAVLTVWSGVERDRTGDLKMVLSAAGNAGESDDSEYKRIQDEIRKYEAILAQKEADKKAELEAQRRTRALQEARERLEELRGQVEMGAGDFKAGEVKLIKLPGGATMEMVWCPPGSFMMGSPTSENPRDNDETQHKVMLTKGFWMGKYEVTQRQWESVMGDNPSRFKGADRPVEQVSWNDCQEFIRKINASGEVMVSLPTEAQWEYACRAGTTTPFSFGSSLNGDKANCDGNYPYGTTAKGQYREATAPVGSYSPNAWGLYDMHGNVWEWCADWYGDYPTGSVTDPTGPASGSIRVLRGGGWFSHAHRCRSALRNRYVPGFRYGDLGFRLVCSAGPRR